MAEKTPAKKAAPARKTSATTKKAPAEKAAPAKKTASAKKTAPAKPADEPAVVEEESPEPKERFHSDDPKEMFRYALEQKKNRSGFGSESHLSSGSSTKGKSAKAGGKREFRRKSG